STSSGCSPRATSASTWTGFAPHIRSWRRPTRGMRPAGASWPWWRAAPSTARSSTATSKRRCATPPALPAAPAIAAADSAAVTAAAQAWVAWADALVFTGPGAPAAWVPDRLEYAFGTSSPDGITLEAAEYSDGQVDWHAFDATGTPATPSLGRGTLGPV